MVVIEDLLRYVKKRKSQNRQVGYFSPLRNFNCSYLKIGLCDLFPVLFECITYMNKRLVTFCKINDPISRTITFLTKYIICVLRKFGNFACLVCFTQINTDKTCQACF